MSDPEGAVVVSQDTHWEPELTTTNVGHIPSFWGRLLYTALVVLKLRDALVSASRAYATTWRMTWS